MKTLFGTLLVAALVVLLAVPAQAGRRGGFGDYGFGGRDDGRRHDGRGEKVLSFHTLVGAPGTDLGAPVSITFESLNTACNTPTTTFSFYLNGTLIGQSSGDPDGTCSCLAPITTFVVDDAALLASAWLRGQPNELAFTKHDLAVNGNAFAWTRATISDGTESATVCVAEVNGGTCSEEASLCNAGYVFGDYSQASQTDVLFTNRHTLRDLPSAEAARELRDAEGGLKADGDIDVKVKGLVLAGDGTNPDGQFKAVVSCIGSDESGRDVVVNLATELRAASVRGNAHIRGHVDLPERCLAPVVFIANEAGEWLAVTGR